MFARLLPVDLVQITLKRNSTSPYKSIFDMNLHTNKFKLRRNINDYRDGNFSLFIWQLEGELTFSTVVNYAKDDAKITRREKT